jgi:membrane-associated phospholipid phosphatase
MAGHAYSARAVRQGRPVLHPWRSGPAGALGVAALCVVAMALLWTLAALVPGAHYRDAVLLHDFTRLDRWSIDRDGKFLLHLLDPLLFILWGIALVAVALARERPRVAVAVVAIMGLAPLTAETLKPLLAHRHASFDGTHIGPASWPSGHSTAALALVLSAVLVASDRLRPLVCAVGAVFAGTVGCLLLILEWHMPSDVIGGYLVAMLWTALAVAALRASERRWPRRRRS